MYVSMYVEGTHMCLEAAYLKICQAVAYGKPSENADNRLLIFPTQTWASSYHVCVAKCFGGGRKHAN